jgi:hypothetical protein
MSQTPRWTLIVMRAWLDTEGVRVRMLGTDSAGRDAEVVVASHDDALRIVDAWLDDLEGGTGDGTGEGR